MKYTIIVAIGANNEIGKDNGLLWHLPRDMQFFKKTTMDHVVIMGRKNWESIPERFRPLSNRENIVLTRNLNYSADGAKLITKFSAIPTAVANPDKKCFIIGGAQIYQLALDDGNVHEMYITHVEAAFDADTFFPSVDLSSWQQEVILKQEKDDKNPYAFTVKRYWKEA